MPNYFKPDWIEDWKTEREKGMIKFEGQWLPEGSTEFPWEQH